MGKAQDLANRFEQANADFIRAVEGVSDEKWTGKAPDEDRPRGAIAHHVASSIPILVGVAQGVSKGAKWPVDGQEQLDEWNASQAAQNAGRTKSEVLDMLRQNGAAAAQAVRGMTDEELTEGTVMVPTFNNQEMTGADVIEHVVIGHNSMHIQSISN